MKEFLVVYPLQSPAIQKPKLYKKYGNRIKYMTLLKFHTLAGAEEFAKTKVGAKVTVFEDEPLGYHEVT